VSDPARELDELLATDPEALRRRLRARFEESAGRSSPPLVLVGAGELGRIALGRMKSAGETPLAFADNNPALQGQGVDGVPVLAPPDAVERHGSRAAFVIAAYNTAGLRSRLEAAGARRIVSYLLLFGARHEVFLPFMCLDRAESLLAAGEQVRAGFALFAEEASRREYVAQVRARLFADADTPAAAVPMERRRDEYFPADVYRSLDDEVFVDAGAFDGDTVRRFVERRAGRFARVHALEPDPASHGRLRANVAALGTEVASRVKTWPLAVSDHRGKLTFEASGQVTSAATGSGAAEVPCDSLDRILADERPTLVKMDPEGGELPALRGMRGIFRTHAPVAAVTVYHRQAHLWEIPLLLHELAPECALFLRAHAEACWDASCYAVPSARACRGQ